MASPPLASVCVARFPHTRFLRSPPGRRGEGAKFVGVEGRAAGGNATECHSEGDEAVPHHPLLATRPELY